MGQKLGALMVTVIFMIASEEGSDLLLGHFNNFKSLA